MATENLIYIAFNDTESNLRSRLENGEFGFATDTKGIVYKDQNGVITIYINPTTAGTVVNGGTILPTENITEGSLFNLTSGDNPGLYRYTAITSSTFQFLPVTPLATSIVNGRITAINNEKLENFETNVDNRVNIVVPVITDTTGGRLTNVNAIKFASISSNAEENVVKNVTPGNGLSITAGGILSLDKFTISRVESFTTTEIRNADSSILWAKGDIVVITTTTNSGSYIYSGTNLLPGTVWNNTTTYLEGSIVSFVTNGINNHYIANTDILIGEDNPSINSNWTIRVTTDADWTLLVTPSSTVSNIKQGDNGTFESGSITIPTAGTNTLGLLAAADFDRINANETALTDAPLSARVEGFIPEITPTIGGRLSNVDAVKFDSIASGAEVNVQSDFATTNIQDDSYIKNRQLLLDTHTLNDFLNISPLTSADGSQTVVVNSTLGTQAPDFTLTFNVHFAGEGITLSKTIVDSFLTVGETLKFSNGTAKVVSITTLNSIDSETAIIKINNIFVLVAGETINTVVDNIDANITYKPGDLIFFKTNFYGCYVAYTTIGTELTLPTANFRTLG